MTQTHTELATFGGGCFWCLEAVFEALEGVEHVTSGFSGGEVKNPSYHEVCSGSTGHAEVVQIAFDPGRIGYRDLVEIFFAFHDPTTLNRQGPDQGTQYRSAIYFHSPEQERIAREVIATLNAAHTWNDPIVTEVAAYDTFYAADAGHQGYFRNHPSQPYCQAMISPKITKLRAKFAARLKRSSAAR
jgi:peptide-methionine (S)-S-oxide reductase